MEKSKLQRKLYAVGLAGAMVFSLAGCGSSSSTSSTSSTSTTASDTADASSEAAQETAAEAYDGEVRTVIVGTGTSAPPFCYLDEDGNSIGYDLDVLHELDARLPQYEFDIQAMDFSTLIVSIDSGAVDMIAHELVQSSERKEKYIFPEQYYCLSAMGLAVLEDSDINVMQDMAGKVMELNPSQYEYQMVMSWNADHPGYEVDLRGITDESTADSLLKVSTGQTDAFLTYKATYESVVPELGVDNIRLTDVVMCEDTYLMFPQSEQQLCDDINGALVEMLEDGTLSQISNDWYGEDVFTLYADLIQIVAD